jgi:DNA-directed RNA polymerase specialized sigma24 family protein
MFKKKDAHPRNPAEGSDDSFPETVMEVLEEAAEGNWTRFFRDYLAPCWREILLSCRNRNLPLDDATDLFQELTVRLLSAGESKQNVAGALPGEQRGNIAKRFLHCREVGLQSARFRTYLKKVIQNLIWEQLRDKRRQPKVLASEEMAVLEPWVNDSVSSSVDRQWVNQCLDRAAEQLHFESRAASTRGRRRLFAILYQWMVKGQTAEAIALELGLDRTTVAELLIRSRHRFVEILGQITGIQSREELKRHVEGDPARLIESLTSVHDNWKKKTAQDERK